MQLGYSWCYVGLQLLSWLLLAITLHYNDYDNIIVLWNLLLIIYNNDWSDDKQEVNSIPYVYKFQLMSAPTDGHNNQGNGETLPVTATSLRD